MAGDAVAKPTEDKAQRRVSAGSAHAKTPNADPLVPASASPAPPLNPRQAGSLTSKLPKLAAIPGLAVSGSHGIGAAGGSAGALLGLPGKHNGGILPDTLALVR